MVIGRGEEVDGATAYRHMLWVPLAQLARPSVRRMLSYFNTYLDRLVGIYLPPLDRISGADLDIYARNYGSPIVRYPTIPYSEGV